MAPYGVYDLTANIGWVNAGIDHDTAGFAVGSIRRWWREIGQAVYQQPTRLLFAADCGTSKWNRIERRMFCHITANRHGRPLISRQVVVNLIGSATTQESLRIQAALDGKTYTPGIKISVVELATERDDFHGEGTIACCLGIRTPDRYHSTYFCFRL